MKKMLLIPTLVSLLFASTFTIQDVFATPKEEVKVTQASTQESYKTVTVDGLKVFYREAGPLNKPTIVLLHGFPTSSHMFRNLIPTLAKNYHVIAPDLPGFGNTDAPSVDEFEYSFDHVSSVVDHFLESLKISRYSLYVMDYGAPIGFRIATKHPERIQALVVQNGNAYDEGLKSDFWNPLKVYWADPSKANAAPLTKFLELGATQWQYTNGVKNLQAISPDNWVVDQAYLDRPGNKEIQLALFKSYASNPTHYAEWQAYFRKHQPAMLIEWGKNDVIFPAEGAYPYQRDLKNVELHLLDTGHFALEEYSQQIGQDMVRFLNKNITQ
jgi:pimeloyl-ACP methyl ester carboxylesterase